MYQDFRPFELNTQRLLIRPVIKEDAADFFEFISNPNVTKYLTFEPYRNLRGVKKLIVRMNEAFYAGSDLNLSVILKSENKVIGSVSLEFFENNNVTEIGYLFSDAYWNKGYAKEAAKAVIDYAFDTYHVEKVLADYISENTASKKVLERLGFTVIGVEEKGFKKSDIRYDLVKCELLKP